MPSNTNRQSAQNGWTALPIFLAGALFFLWHSASLAAGFREIEAQDVRFGLWYPSDAPVKLQRLGPFETEMARDGPIREGQYEVVLFSHGNGGRYRNHYLTAQVLADAGFVVIAPQHEADYLVGGGKTAQALDHRYLEMARALKAVRETPELSDHLAQGTVHGVGYSLGGMTIMLASGAGFTSEKIKRHCESNGRQDAAFCGASKFRHRTIQSFRHDPDLRATSDPFRNAPIITGKTVVIAPAYQGLDLSAPLAMADLTVIAIIGDRIAQPKFHAEPLYEAARKQVRAVFGTISGHHYGFIAPFPQWLTHKEDIPVAKDPEGFDRSAFLRAANAMILTALTGGGA